MIIIPAIDIKDGVVVRLLQGDFDKVTEYSKDPAGLAKKFSELGAPLIHVVDLDGAKTGELKNFEILKKIITGIKTPVEFGGGIRDEATIKKLLDLGVKRVILTTKAVEDEKFLRKILKEFADRIVISIDSKFGFLALRGWREVSSVQADLFAKHISGLGVKTIIYTDVSTDGALSGPSINGIKKMLAVISNDTNIVSSGGISSLKDIENLKKIKDKRLEGAIIGRAIYEGKLDLKKAIELCLQKE